MSLYIISKALIRGIAGCVTDDIVTGLNHLLFTGTYPLFPWMVYAVVGAFLGSSITEGGKHFQGITPPCY